jgi:hypothetical protein
MKTLELKNTDAAIRQYEAELSQGPLVFTRGGKAVAALVRIRQADLESLLVSESPALRRIVQGSRQSYRRSGGLTREQMEQRLRKATSAR